MKNYLKALLLNLTMPKEERNDERSDNGCLHGVLLWTLTALSKLTIYFYSRKHRHSEMAGLLACNISAVLLIRQLADNGHCEAKTIVLLTVARQLVIFTRFPFHPDLDREPW